MFYLFTPSPVLDDNEYILVLYKMPADAFLMICFGSYVRLSQM